MLRKNKSKLIIVIVLISCICGIVQSSETVSINTNVDIYNRYVWRGLDIANTPSIQPSLSIASSNFEFGTWGAYTLSNQSSEADEIDFWMSYSINMNNGASLQLLATDYYFPNAGVKFFNFNNHDAVIDDTIPDPGAHTIEIGASYTGPESFPVTLSGFINVHNDAGNNTYFQIDFPVSIGESEVDLFCGVAGGSEENPGYYGADKMSIINLGLSTGRDIKVSDTFTMPLTFMFIVNPKEEVSHILVGVSF